ncbi:hypothetical protein QYE76_064821 [Lolium multiflorum]|uniref:Integrase zinc-binding domain-containing protein n=1 Tax=Lolium multiflorum TaxID=4521 RepID=A0AAD8S792_LOLMU|nr:hypothetical protein QYE76_064821 [Lolium multiflorum]
MLSKLGSGLKPIPPGIFLEHLRIPSVKGANAENPDLAVSPAREVMAIIPAWTQPFLDYLIDRKLPEDEVLVRQIIRRARSYTIVDGQLYKRSANGVFLKCVSNQDGIEILREIHAGDCGHHAAPRSLVAKAFRLGFWLTAKEDAEKLVKTCRGYLTKSYSRLCGRRTPERKEFSGGQESGEIPSPGEIDAIAIAIELDIISIIIIIISTIYTAITTAAPRHRCNDLGWILII